MSNKKSCRIWAFPEPSGLWVFGKEGREQEELFTPAGRNLCWFLQRWHSHPVWELEFKVLRLPSQVEPYCHVPNKGRTISPKQRNSKAAMEAHSNWNLSICRNIILALLLLCLYLSARWGGGRMTDLSFILSDQRFPSFSRSTWGERLSTVAEHYSDMVCLSAQGHTV